MTLKVLNSQKFFKPQKSLNSQTFYDPQKIF